MSKSPIVELAVFKLSAGVEESTFSTAAAAINPLVSKYPGYLRRTLMKGDNGYWADTVYWKDLESAQRAAEQVMQDAEFAKFVSMIDQSSMLFLHLEPEREFN